MVCRPAKRPAQPEGMMAAGNPDTARLAGARRATMLAMMVERAWPLVLPLLLVVALGLIAAWSGLARALPDPARLAVTGALLLAALAALLPLARFRLPTADAIDRRLETANALAHRPVSALADRPAIAGDAFGAALWAAHQRRMAARLGAVRPDAPRPGIPRRDPFALRALVVLVLVAAFAFSHGPRGGALADLAGRPAAPALPPRIDAWLTPPAYTRLPPILLSAENATPREAPAGSALAVRLTGGTAALAFEPATGPARPLEPAADARDALAFADTLVADGAWVVRDGGRELARWPFTAIADTPPAIAFAAEPRRGKGGGLELAYTVTDDYGAAAARAELVPADQAPGARPLYPPPEMPLALPRRGADAAKTVKDVAKHPLAGGRFAITLVARDAAGQEGRSATKIAVLPERRFANPLARAVIEQRRLLAADANAARRVLDLMDAITLRPDDTIRVAAHFLGIVTARSRLAMAKSDDDLRGVVDYLWTVAIGIEEGDLSDAAKALRQAEERLKQALDDNASDEEIAQLMDELRRAMDNFLKELAENAQKPQAGDRADTEELRRNDLDRMMDQIERLSKSGQKDKARDLLSQLQDMMENLQANRGQQGDQAQSPMRQQMNRLGELMRRQQELMNETDRTGRSPPQGQQRPGEAPGGLPQPGGPQGQDGEGGNELAGPGEGLGSLPGEGFGELQDRQGQLRGELGQLMDELEGMGIKPGKGFGEAGEAMDNAGEALGEGERQGAVGEQGRALEALRRGAEDMMRQMRQAQQGGEGGSEAGGQRNGDNRDPLGRPEATTGPDFGDGTEVPDEIDAERARRILEAIRKRLGDALSPELERSYLERLLDLR